jgi:hypothetical protein
MKTRSMKIVALLLAFFAGVFAAVLFIKFVIVPLQAKYDNATKAQTQFERVRDARQKAMELSNRKGPWRVGKVVQVSGSNIRGEEQVLLTNKKGDKESIPFTAGPMSIRWGLLQGSTVELLFIYAAESDKFGDHLFPVPIKQ